MLDTACHDSYISDRTRDELGCQPYEWKNISVEVFGTDKPVTYKSGIVQVDLLGREGEVIPLELFSIDRMCGTVPAGVL